MRQTVKMAMMAMKTFWNEDSGVKEVLWNAFE
jgi:hypothetical protein